jgi:hypothetical protein
MMFGASWITSLGVGACRTVALIVKSFAGVVGGAPPPFRAPSVFSADGRDVHAPLSPRALGPGFVLGLPPGTGF